MQTVAKGLRQQRPFFYQYTKSRLVKASPACIGSQEGSAIRLPAVSQSVLKKGFRVSGLAHTGVRMQKRVSGLGFRGFRVGGLEFRAQNALEWHGFRPWQAVQ